MIDDQAPVPAKKRAKTTKPPKAPPTLDEVYAKIEEMGKVSPSLEKAIRIHPQSDFSRIDPRYCKVICKLCEKDPHATESSFLRKEVDVLFIQDHRSVPTKYENGRGFVNRDEPVHWGILNFLTQKAGYDKDKISWEMTSLLRCKPTHTDFPGGKPPTETKMGKCSPYLLEEIRRVKPKVIVTLGTASTKALGLKGVSNSGNRGHIVFSEQFGIPVIASLHPRILSYIRQNARGAGGFWGPDYFNVLLRDVLKAKRIAQGLLEVSPTSLTEAVERYRKVIRITRSLDEVRALVAELYALPEDLVVSFDTETTGVDPLAEGFKLLTIQFGWLTAEGLVAVVVPLWHRANTEYPGERAWALLRPWIESNRPKVGHNSKFDVLAIYWGTMTRVRGLSHDTLLMMHSLESGTQGCYSLKTAIWDRLPELGLGGYEDLLGDLSDIDMAAIEAEAETAETVGVGE
jgi:uracil-DNA glycosylase family 4